MSILCFHFVGIVFLMKIMNWYLSPSNLLLAISRWRTFFPLVQQEIVSFQSTEIRMQFMDLIFVFNFTLYYIWYFPFYLVSFLLFLLFLLSCIISFISFIYSIHLIIFYSFISFYIIYIQWCAQSVLYIYLSNNIFLWNWNDLRVQFCIFWESLNERQWFCTFCKTTTIIAEVIRLSFNYDIILFFHISSFF